MRIDTLPTIEISDSLLFSDVTVFASHFSELIKRKVPTAQVVDFFSLQGFKKSSSAVPEKEKEQIFNDTVKNGRPDIFNEDALVLPLGPAGTLPMVAMVSGLDQLVVKKMSREWLVDTADELLVEFLAIKRSKIDPVTLLYSNILLTEFLSGESCSKRFHIVLVELFPGARTPKEVFNHSQNAASSLKTFDRYGFPLFHLGQSIFAYIIPDSDRGFIKKFCMSLITVFKRKGFKRVHCGCSSLNGTRDADFAGKSVGLVVLDEAWTALQVACRRGPFAFCDFDLLAHPDHFPLVNLPRSVVSKIQRRWADSASFSLVYFIPDYQKLDKIIDIIVRYFGKHNYVLADKGFWVIRREMAASQSRQWAIDTIKEIIEVNGDGYSLSAGISEYPFTDYSRAEIIKNCQKAILHGEFLGPGSVVIFDAVSLNISGDIYYGEGDLAGAVREYRRGLLLDSTDVNLLNSLGVAYALMNRVKEAQIAFDRVLHNDPANFMALYNKGLGDQSAGRYRDALRYYKYAYDSLEEKTAKNEIVYDDLAYQLGVCHFQVGDFAESIKILTRWFENQNDTEGRGKACRYIGISHYRLSRKKEAMQWLQRALAYEEYDAEALNLLGELYHYENQGDEIALSLLEKSMEIEAKNIQFSLRYARVLNSLSRHEEALVYLRRCVRNRQTRPESWYEMAFAYNGLNKYNKIRYYLEKLINEDGASQLLKGKARLLSKKITQGRNA